MLERSVLENASLKSLKQAASLGFLPKQIITLNSPPTAKKKFYTITFPLQPLEQGSAELFIEQPLALVILKAYGFENPQEIDQDTTNDALKEFGELIFGNIKNILPNGLISFGSDSVTVSLLEDKSLSATTADTEIKQLQFHYLLPPHTLCIRFSLCKSFQETQTDELETVSENHEEVLPSQEISTETQEISEADIAAIQYYFQTIKKTLRDFFRRPKAFRRLRFRSSEIEHSLFHINRERKGGAWFAEGNIEIDSFTYEFCFFLNQSLLAYCLGIVNGFPLEKIEEWVRHSLVTNAEPASVKILLQDLLSAYEAVFTKVFQKRVNIHVNSAQFTKLRDLMLLDDHKRFIWHSNTCELFVNFTGTFSFGISQKIVSPFLSAAYKIDKMIKKSKQLEKDRKKALKEKENRKLGKKTLILHSSFRMNYQFIKSCIDENTYKTFDAEDVESCMMFFRKYFVHAVVLGINGPNDKAFEVIDAVRNSEQVWKTPIIAMAMKPSKEIIVASMQRGADKFMVCPTPKDIFSKSVEEIFTEKFL